MAASDETLANEIEIVSEFPKPPNYYEMYAKGSKNGPSPPAPMSPTYHVFGTAYSTKDEVTDLLPQDGKKLYDSNDRSAIQFKAEMKKLNKSLLANYIELVDILIENPSQFQSKLADLELLFLNIHNLINAFRPHQARETLITMLTEQIDERKNAIEEFQSQIENCKRVVNQAHGNLDSIDDQNNNSLEELKSKKEANDDRLNAVHSSEPMSIE